jgi:histidyl-tRNA synthetase
LLEESRPALGATLDAYVVFTVEQQGNAWTLAEQLRNSGLAIAVHGSADGAVSSFKSQMKKADASGARFAIILGPDEAAEGKISLKALRGEGGQARLTVDEAVNTLWNAASAIDGTN